MLKAFSCRLPSRRVLRVRGTDAHEFLQGLFTNDLRELKPSGSMYGCFLYFTGRVLCDACLYQCGRVHDGQSSILVDVHEEALENVLDHMMEMKMRKSITIENVSGELAVVASLVEHKEGASPPPEADATQLLEDRHAETFRDPRSSILFPPSSSSPWTLEKKVVTQSWAPLLTHADDYDQLLFRHGVGEGPVVFKDNKTLPFEGNLDFIGGVNFHKGCYVGQELTHRTHVMLVTRKRTVPLTFPAAADGEGSSRPVRVGESLYSAKKEKIGEVTGVSGSVGVGLLRLRYVDKESHTVPGLQLDDGTPVSMHFPAWWPPKQIKKLLKNN